MVHAQSNPVTPLPFKLNLMDSVQLADFLTNKPNTVEGWRIKGIGPKYIKIGRLVRYRLADVEEWIESQARTSTTQAGA
jgi:hypothetical protein